MQTQQHDSITFGQARDAFFDYCRGKNLSPATIKWYTFRIGAIVNHFADNHPGMRPNEVTITELREMVTALIDTASTTTINHTVVACRTWFRFLVEDGYLAQSPAERLDRIKAPRILIKPFTDEQVAALLAQPNKRRFSGIRDYTMMVLLLDCGLRLSEITGLKLQDVDWKLNTVKVMGKGSKERVVPFGRNARKALNDYMGRRGDTPGDEHLFLNEFADGLSNKGFQDALRRYGTQAGVTGVRVSPHTFRHTFAVNWVRNSGDVFHLQRILGHSSLEICRWYVNLVTDDLQKAHAVYSPMDRMMGEAKPTTGRTRLR